MFLQEDGLDHYKAEVMMLFILNSLNIIWVGLLILYTGYGLLRLPCGLIRPTHGVRTRRTAWKTGAAAKIIEKRTSAPWQPSSNIVSRCQWFIETFRDGVWRHLFLVWIHDISILDAEQCGQSHQFGWYLYRIHIKYLIPPFPTLQIWCYVYLQQIFPLDYILQSLLAIRNNGRMY